MTDLADTLKEALRMTTTKLPVDLSAHGIDPAGRVYRNPSTSLLYTHALARGDGRLAEGGSLVVDTGKFTGRSPKDKFLVDEPSSTDRIWWGEVNQKLAESSFDSLREKVSSHLAAADALFVIDAWAGADPAHRISARVTAHPYRAVREDDVHRPTSDELASFRPKALVCTHGPRGRS
jgi:phosphoenolpyruvate carboxykinase (ATP)